MSGSSKPFRARFLARLALLARLMLNITLVLSSQGLWGCAASLPQPYVQNRAAAERAYAHGRYAEAAAYWQTAAARAERHRDRDHALARRAASLKRAGELPAATAQWRDLAAHAHGKPERSKAIYELAVLALEAGRREDASAQLERLLTEYPNTPIAASALKRQLRLMRERQTDAQFVAWIQSQATTLKATELGEAAAFEHARALEQTGNEMAALERYLRVAERYPYPQGAYWDDALWRAAGIEERAGRPERALAHLARLLREREPSHFAGSYERSIFAKAQLERGELYRDALNRPDLAMQEFLALWRDYPTSILRDDGLWAAARLAHSRGDSDLLCRLRRELEREAPESRYRGCLSQLCPGAGPGAKCQDYLRRQLAGAAVEPAGSSEPGPLGHPDAWGP